MKRLLPFIVLAGVLFGAIFFWGRDTTPRPSRSLSGSDAPAVTRTIDLDNALAVALPTPSPTLTPAAFRTPDGKCGWVVRLPGVSGFAGGLPLPTPAYDNGKLYLGGGFASFDFYAINASTGEMIWHSPTTDNGPTSASVDHGNVAFNTQSCSLQVMDENNGQTLWKQWLGDPLVSQPAISKGRVYTSFPNRSYGGEAVGASAAITPPPSSLAFIQGAGQEPAGSQTGASGGYTLLCADVSQGSRLWCHSLPDEIISAPAIVGGRIYLACCDGTVECLNAASGAAIWSRGLRATSAPVEAQGRVVVTVRVDRKGNPYEGIVRLDSGTGELLDRKPLVLSPAPYLTDGSGVGIDPAIRRELDSLEGFPSGLPTSFQVGETATAFDMSSVAGAWAYQGSRVGIASGRILNAEGAFVNAVSATSGGVLWRDQVAGKDVQPNSQVFSPPAIGKQSLYLCSGTGDLVAVRQSTGIPVFAYTLGHPVATEPILARGNIYISTSDGLLICIKTGGKDASGWLAWGGSAQHDKAN